MLYTQIAAATRIEEVRIFFAKEIVEVWQSFYCEVRMLRAWEQYLMNGLIATKT